MKEHALFHPLRPFRGLWAMSLLAGVPLAWGQMAVDSAPAPTVTAPTVPAAPVVERVPLVAISPLEARGLGADEAATISDNLATRLQQLGKLRVMERSRMDQILKEQSFQQSGACNGGECAVEVGRVLGLDQMVVGSVGKVGSTWSLNLRLVDVGTGEALRTSTRNQQGSIDQVLTDLVPDAARELMGEAVAERPRPTAPAVQVRESGRPLWPWIVGGSAVVGGIAAAVLLTQDETSAKSTTSTVHAGW